MNELEARLNSPGGWGEYGSDEHTRYAVEYPDKRRRRKCFCGCGQKESHIGMANGVALMGGCELRVRRWIRDGSSAPVRSQQENGE